MGQNSGRIYEFGQFRLDVARHRLFHLEESVPIRRKTYEILLMLVESGGELVEKEKILDQVWNSLSVEENNLTQHIHKLRRILGDTTKDQEYILTSITSRRSAASTSRRYYQGSGIHSDSAR